MRNSNTHAQEQLEEFKKRQTEVTSEQSEHHKFRTFNIFVLSVKDQCYLITFQSWYSWIIVVKRRPAPTQRTMRTITRQNGNRAKFVKCHVSKYGFIKNKQTPSPPGVEWTEEEREICGRQSLRLQWYCRRAVGGANLIARVKSHKIFSWYRSCGNSCSAEADEAKAEKQNANGAMV